MSAKEKAAVPLKDHRNKNYWTIHAVDGSQRIPKPPQGGEGGGAVHYLHPTYSRKHQKLAPRKRLVNTEAEDPALRQILDLVAAPNSLIRDFTVPGSENIYDSPPLRGAGSGFSPLKASPPPMFSGVSRGTKVPALESFRMGLQSQAGHQSQYGDDAWEYAMSKVQKHVDFDINEDFKELKYWTKHMEVQEDCLKAVQSMADILEHAQSATNKMPQPNTPLTGVCCLLLDNLLSFLVRLQPAFLQIVSEVRNELFMAIFQTSPDKYDFETACQELNPNNAELHSTQFMGSSFFGHATSLEIQLNGSSGPSAEAMEAQYWKEAYLSKVVGAWRALVAQSKEKQKMQDECDVQIQKMQVQVEALKETERFMAERAVKEAKKFQEMQKKFYEVALSAKESRHKADQLESKIINSQNDLLKAHNQTCKLVKIQNELTKATSKHIALESKYSELEDVLAHVVKWQEGASSGDCRLKHLHEATLKLVERDEPPHIMLVSWVNLILAQCPVKQEPMAAWGGSEMWNIFLWMLLILAPRFLSQKEVEELVVQKEPFKKAHKMIEVMHAMQLSLAIKANDLVMSPLSDNHCILLVSLLFQNFCSPTFDAHNMESNPLTRTNSKRNMIEDPSKWWNRVAGAAKAKNAWMALGNKALASGCSLAIEGTESLATEKERPKFTNLSVERTIELLEQDLTLDEGDLVVIEVKKVLNCYFPKLRKVYLFYGAREVGDDSDDRLSFQEFSWFCADCRLDKKVFTKEVLNRIFNQSQGQEDQQEEDNLENDAFMTATEWVEGLVRMAAEMNKGKVPLHKALEMLITEKILPNCAQLDVQDIFKVTRSAPVQNVICKNRSYLLKVFKEYAAAPGYTQMTSKNWELLFREHNFMNEALTVNALKDIWMNTAIAQDGDDTMMFYEFLDAIVAVSAFKVPSPYIDMENKVLQFVACNFLPRLANKCKFKFEAIPIPLGRRRSRGRIPSPNLM